MTDKPSVQYSFLDPVENRIKQTEVWLAKPKEKNTMARLGEYGKIDKSQARETLDDILGLEVEITEAEVKAGNFGDYVRFTCTDARGRTHTVSTGAFLIVDALQDVIAQDKFPVSARFQKKGRTYSFA